MIGLPETSFCSNIVAYFQARKTVPRGRASISDDKEYDLATVSQAHFKSSMSTINDRYRSFHSLHASNWAAAEIYKKFSNSKRSEFTDFPSMRT